MASENVDPITNPQAWDTVTVGGVVSPGKVDIGDVKRKNSWDVKKGKGTLGGTITFVGRDPAEVTLTFTLWKQIHFQQWATFRKNFEFDPTKTAVTAVEIYHPALADINMTKVVTESIGAIKAAGKGVYTIDVALLEYFPPPPKPATGTANGTKGSGANKGGAPGAPPDPIADAQQREVQKLLEQANKL